MPAGIASDPDRSAALIGADGPPSNSSRAAIYVYGLPGLTTEQINNTTEKVQYLHHDQQGSTRLLTGSTGTVEGAYTYDAYGNTTGHTGTATTPLGYDGQLTSSDTGLIYLRARVYDPATAQFMSSDPLKAVTGEPYAYAGDNPLNLADPSGLLSIGEVVGGIEKGVEAGAHFVSEHYGQIAEAGALGLCVATEVGAPVCLAATVAGFGASTYQNVTSPSGFSPAAEALDVLGTFPGLQVTGAELADLLGDGEGPDCGGIA